MRFVPAASALLLAVATSAAIAAVATPSTTKTRVLSVAAADVAVMGASQNHAHVSKTFAGPDGLTGAVITVGSNPPFIGWVTSTGKAVLVNDALYSASGKNLTTAALVDQGILYSPEAALNHAASSASRPIVVGTAGPIITAFFDPNCIFCHLLYKKIAPAIKAGQVRVRFVVVGTLKESSIPRAATILAAANPANALEANESSFDEKAEEGGLAPSTTINAKVKAVVEANNQLFQKAGAHGTPAILFCSKKTGKVEMVEGLPQNLDAFLADVTPGQSAACH